MKQFQTNSSTNESHVIAYEIQKMNKMIVAEQMFSDVYSHKSSSYVPGLKDYFSFDKKVLFLVNVKVQATYDLKKLEVELDEENKTIYIQKVPEMELEIFPDVSIYDLDQSRFNTFEKDELNEIKKRAIEHIEKSIDQKKLEDQAHQQLIENLGELYQLAKIYDWKIIDKTALAKELELKFN
ncbi:DUF4230 domain-containing protein [Moheibacter sp. BDHS18]|uniref:DUF4230 domain-containing protein n=2 Tax=Moheibacter lacus TaxID=2745851 RepID=A0A838ZMQ1_9FLAO|nr:DUF4230 domain-containing protein [Moheibacter lacus]